VTDSSASPAGQAPPSNLDTTVAHTARVWNYWLGGKDNFAPDREVGDAVAQMFPLIRTTARADRAFLGRVVRYLVGEAGIRQILDVGTGLPTANNTHEVAQGVAPETRIVYVDNDPLVLVHARALLTSTPQGATDYIEADLHEPGKILQEAARTLDFDQPIALTMLGVLHFVLDYDEARAIVRELMEALPAGSYLVIAHGCDDFNTEVIAEAITFWNANAKPPIRYRTEAEIVGLFDGYELLEPGVVPCSHWHPDDPDAEPVNQYAGVARKS